MTLVQGEVDRPPRWRSIDHVQEAKREARGPYEEPARPKGIFRRAVSGRCYKPYSGKPGDKFGTLVLESVVEVTKCTGRKWLCRCECGRTAIRSMFYLNKAVRHGHTPMCRGCLYELIKARRDYERDLLKEAYRKQWVDFGTLWLGHQTKALQTTILQDLVEEFGPCEEEYIDASEIDVDPNWPYAPGDRAYAKSNFARWKKKYTDPVRTWEEEEEKPKPLSDDEKLAIQSLDVERFQQERELSEKKEKLLDDAIARAKQVRESEEREKRETEEKEALLARWRKQSEERLERMQKEGEERRARRPTPKPGPQPPPAPKSLRESADALKSLIDKLARAGKRIEFSVK